MSPEAAIKSLASAQGFELCGIANLSQTPERLGFLSDWLSQNFHGDMGWLPRQKAKRLDPTLVLPNAKSVICVGLVYNTDQPYSIQNPQQAHISRYAWGDDYHEIMTSKLAALESDIRAQVPGEYTLKSYSDTGPVSEKTWAAAAGLGWIGKHTNLINQKLGSWFFLGVMLTTLDLKADAPDIDHCGTCTRCLDACPTDAFTAPYVLDARRCISYLTIEKRGDIPEEFHASIGNKLYGCDICQEVCPWNREPPLTHLAAFQPRPGLAQPDAMVFSQIQDHEFSVRFEKSAMKRSKAEGLRRNARIVAQNQKS